MAEDAPLAWRRERAQLLATIERQQQEAAHLSKRFKLLQRTLIDQQALLDRYHRALQQSGALPSPATAANTPTAAATTSAPAEHTADGDNGEDSAMSVAIADSECLKAVALDVRPNAAAAKEADARDTASAHGLAAPQHPQQVTQDSGDAAPGSRSLKRQALASQGTHSTSSASNEPLARERARDNALETTCHDTEPTQAHHQHRVSIAEPTDSRASAQAPSASSSPAKAVQLDEVTATHSPQKDPPDAAVESSKSQSAAPGSGSASWITRKSDFYRTAAAAAEASRLEQSQDIGGSDGDSDTVDDKLLNPDTSTRATGSTVAATTAASAATSALPVVSKKRRAPSTDFAPTWAEEKRRMQDAGLLKTRRRPLPDAKPPLRPDHRRLPSTTDDERPAFQYVEVVRNRDARAALPAHDCVECRKYYAALDGVLSDDDIARAKAACSRHRARFEPYNTPDDFWRLSFPDSQDQAPSP